MGKIIKDAIEFNGISECSSVNTSNFRQLNVGYTFCLPTPSFDLKQILKAWTNAHIRSIQLVKTPVGKSLEGQVVTGYKALVSGDIDFKIDYMSSNYNGFVHSHRATFPFCGYVVLPEDTIPSCSINSRVFIEDVSIEQVKCDCLYISITMMVVADIC